MKLFLYFKNNIFNKILYFKNKERFVKSAKIKISFIGRTRYNILIKYYKDKLFCFIITCTDEVHKKE